MASVDLNADLGEGAVTDAELLPLITSASIACGGHAGDATSIRETLKLAMAHDVAVGAHPSFPDRENFGRVAMAISPEMLRAAMIEQLSLFNKIATELSLRPSHVKPHGALYNMAARDAKLAASIVECIASLNPGIALFAPPNSELELAGIRASLRVVREFFADRNYLPTGDLVPRSRADAILHDPSEAADRVVRVLRDGVVRAVDGTDVAMKIETICLHGDSPEAVAFAKALRGALEKFGVSICAPR